MSVNKKIINCINIDSKNENINNLLNILLVDKNETEIIETLNLINNELDNNGYLLNLDKFYIINVARIKRNMLLLDNKKNIWSKNVARIFGQILKKIKLFSILEKKVLENDNKYKEDIKISIFGDDFLLPKINKLISSKIKIRLLCIGGNHTIILSRYGIVYTCGSNTFGQLGQGDNNPRTNFEKINLTRNSTSKNNKCTYVSAGYAYSSIIINGKIYSCGAGEDGRLASMNYENINNFNKCKIFDNANFSKVQSGSVHQVALSKNNFLYSCGHNDYNGQNKIDNNNLGLSQFKKIDYLNKIKFIQISINMGGYHTLALTASGSVYSWGHNRVGQLGLGHNKLKVFKPTLVKDLSNKITKYIHAGWGHSAALDINNNLHLCGRNTCGQIYFDKNECLINSEDQFYIPYFRQFDNNLIKIVKCGYDQTNIYTSNNNLISFGCNHKGKLSSNNDTSIKKYTIENINKDIVDIISGDKFTIIITCI